MPHSNRNPNVSSRLYILLSTGFRYPTPKLFETFQSGEFLDELTCNLSSIPALMAKNEHLVKQAKDAVGGMSLAEFEMNFTRTFDTGAPVPPCPPYEGHYCEKPRSVVLLEVSEFYNCFGLKMSQENGKREFPDHISAELEFLHFLTYNETLAKGDELSGYLLAQKDFLERHLIQWVPGFCNKLQNSPFYFQLAEIMLLFISCEFELLNADLQELNCEK
ncbi:MAG: molecular chaperone TorD family protein [Candidatus Methanoperedens sp.]